MAAPDRRVQYTEYLVGASHPSLADTVNRLALVDHTSSGAHAAITRDDLTNNDGSSLTTSTVVVQDITGASLFKRTTTLGDVHDVYVLMAAINSADTGRVAYGGFATVNTQGVVAVGDYLYTSSTTGMAASAGTKMVPGVFGRAYTSSGGGAGTVTALLFSYVSPAFLQVNGLGIGGAAGSIDTITLYGATSGSTVFQASATASGTITLPATTGTVITTGNLSSITATGTVSSGTWQGGVIAGLYGGTGLSAAAVGDLIYASATTPTWSRLAAVAVGSYLRANGVNAAPLWSTLTLPNSATSGDLLTATGTNAIGSVGIGSGGTILRSTGSAPAWSTATYPGTVASGDLLTATGTNAIGVLNVGGSGQILRSTGSAPAWSNTTWPNAATAGDLVAASAGNTFSTITAVAAGSFLRSAGVNTVPAWSTTTWPNSSTTGDIVHATGSNVYGNLAAVAVGQVLISKGTSTVPAWSQTVGLGVAALADNGSLGLKGTGQTGATTFTDSPNGGAMGGSINLQDSGSSTNNGGAIVFGSSQGFFAAIKAQLKNGTGPLGDLVFFTRTAGTGALSEGMRFYSTGGLGMQGAADQGAGTINVTGNLYKNASAYNNPDYVLEHWVTGAIAQFADREGAAEYDGLQPLSEVEAFLRGSFVLPRIAQARARNDGRLGLFDGGDAVLATLEESYLYLFDHEHRIQAQADELAALRARVADLEARGTDR